MSDADTAGDASGATATGAALDALLDLLDVRPAPAGEAAQAFTGAGEEAQTFTGAGAGHDEYGLYGGHTMGQAVVAAARTVGDERRLNSLHAYFLRGGDGTAPVDYAVETVRDGRAFATRRVRATQRPAGDRAGGEAAGEAAAGEIGRRIIELAASFHTPETGSAEMSVPAPAGLADPETLPTFHECIAEVGPIFGEHWSNDPRPVDYRLAHAPWAPSGPSERGGIDFWFRAPHRMPDDPVMHAAVLVYMSDDCIADNVTVPYGRTWGSPGTHVVSLDHAMWVHRPVRVDEWVYVEQWPLVATGARGTSEARFWQDGRLVATALQEALARF
ncbi:MAG TPA: acyl-CoA thioesterase II [Acidimicrobiaceae bacterium]|nr:acyl-CoA thioesterase II [Acidimicrobiaceae bacterium]